jgi:hypothetical protein
MSIPKLFQIAYTVQHSSILSMALVWNNFIRNLVSTKSNDGLSAELAGQSYKPYLQNNYSLCLSSFRTISSDASRSMRIQHDILAFNKLFTFEPCDFIAAVTTEKLTSPREWSLNEMADLKTIWSISRLQNFRHVSEWVKINRRIGKIMQSMWYCQTVATSVSTFEIKLIDSTVDWKRSHYSIVDNDQAHSLCSLAILPLKRVSVSTLSNNDFKLKSWSIIIV